jgi:tRNA pseudouridine32 synthase / 23S rRNA pseudouridine746 synthase
MLPPLFADESLLVLEKPSGLLAVPGRGEDKQDCLSARVQAVFPDAQIVHRLDMGTSGLMVMARGVIAQRVLSEAFANRRVEKRYEAVVAGKPACGDPNEAGWCCIDLPIALDWPNRPMRIIDAASGKPSLTHWRALDRSTAFPDSTRLELAPLTGRSHQLRVHLKAIGHPILGDALYAPQEGRQGVHRLLLHATRLRLPHPCTGEMMDFESPVPF